MKKCMIIVAFILVLTACSSVPTKTVDLIESTDVQSDNPSPSPLPQKFTPIPETPPVVPKEAILFKQDFETGSYLGMNLNPNDWAVNLDGSGNHSLCNKSLDYFHSFDTGYSIYDNFAIEVNVKPIAMKDNPYVTLYARYDIEKKLVIGEHYLLIISIILLPASLPITTLQMYISKHQLTKIICFVWKFSELI